MAHLNIRTKKKKQVQRPEVQLGTCHKDNSEIFDYSVHKLNRSLKMSNDLICLANRLSYSLHDSLMLSSSETKLLKLVNIAVPKATDRNSFLKSKKFTDYLKEKALVIATHGF